MQSIRVSKFGGPEVLQLTSLPDPKPGAGEVLVAVHAIGVNPVDTYIREGIYGPREFPFTPGTDAAGVVEAVGPGAADLKIGSRVYIYQSITGAYASKVLCKASQVYALPDRLSFRQGAGVGVPFGTAYRALFIRGKAKASEIILIHGASGGVGTAAVQLAKRAGLIVIGTAGSDKGLELIKKLGGDHALNHKDPAHLQQVMSLTGGKGANLVIEMLANINLDKDLGVLIKGGRVVIIGSRGRAEIDPRQTMAKDSDIRGMSLMHADDAELKMIHADLLKGFEDGSLTPIIGRDFPISEAPAAHEAVRGNAGSEGKILLIP